MAAEGKKIAEVKCTSCHKPTDEKLVGPGWKGITTRQNPHWIMNFITNPDPMINVDPELQKQLEQNGQIKTAMSYHYAMRSFKTFREGRDIELAAIDSVVMSEYEYWLKRKDRLMINEKVNNMMLEAFKQVSEIGINKVINKKNLKKLYVKYCK